MAAAEPLLTDRFRKEGRRGEAPPSPPSSSSSSSSSLLSRGCEGFIYGRQQRRFQRHLFKNRVYGRSHFQLIDIGGV